MICAHCKMDVPNEATTCPYCHKDPRSAAKVTAALNKIFLAVGCLGVIVLCLGGWLILFAGK